MRTAGKKSWRGKLKPKDYRMSPKELMIEAAYMWEKESRRMMDNAQKESGLVARTLREIAVGLQNKARWAREYAGVDDAS